MTQYPFLLPWLFKGIKNLLGTIILGLFIGFVAGLLVYCLVHLFGHEWTFVVVQRWSLGICIGLFALAETIKSFLWFPFAAWCTARHFNITMGEVFYATLWGYFSKHKEDRTAEAIRSFLSSESARNAVYQDALNRG